MVDPLSKLIHMIQGRGVKKVCVEAGHIYRDQKPGQEHMASFTVGADICFRIIFAMRIDPHRMVLIDDYNPAADNFCLRNYLQLASDCDFEPDEVVWESNLVEEAQLLTMRLVNEGDAISNGDGSIQTVKNGIRLRHADGRPSCCALDAALYVRRFAEHDFNVTVLPNGVGQDCANQQRCTRRLLRLLGCAEKLPLANVYFGPDGGITVGLPK